MGLANAERGFALTFSLKEHTVGIESVGDS